MIGLALSDARLALRFWSKVPNRSPWPEDCWEWAAGVDKAGYGRFYTKEQSSEQAHQVAWRLSGSEIPSGWEIDHACRNRRCQRPEHLSITPPGSSSIQGGERTAAKCRARTHCRNGHEMTHKNKYITTMGYWQCRECHRICESNRRNK